MTASDARPQYRPFGIVSSELEKFRESHLSAGTLSSSGCKVCEALLYASELILIIEAECMSGGEWDRLFTGAVAQRDALAADLASAVVRADRAEAVVRRVEDQRDRWLATPGVAVLTDVANRLTEVLRGDDDVTSRLRGAVRSPNPDHEDPGDEL